MKRLKAIISLIFFLILVTATVFNVLFIFDIVVRAFPEIGLLALIISAALIGLIGIIAKNVRKEQYVSINIFTPAKEIGRLYGYVFAIWGLTYFIIVFFK